MLSATSCSYCATISAAELRLPAVQLAHVGARVRRLQPGHAVRAAQLDDHDVGALGLAAQAAAGSSTRSAGTWSSRPRRRTYGRAAGRNRRSGRARPSAAGDTRWRTQRRSGGIRSCSVATSSRGSWRTRSAPKSSAARARLAPSRTGRRRRCTGAGRAPPARGAPRRRRPARPRSRSRARRRPAARTRRAARCRAPGRPGRAGSPPSRRPPGSRPPSAVPSACSSSGVPGDDRQPPVLGRALAAAARGRRGSTGRPRSRSAPRRR